MTRPIRIISKAPAVFLIGETKANPAGIDDYLRYRELTWNSDSYGSYAGSALIEFGGRICYESFNNPKDDSPADYIGRTALGKKHWSITRHVQMNFAIASLPRHSLAELTRHHVGTAFSVRSSRYVDTYLEFVIPPAMRDNNFLLYEFEAMCKEAAEQYEYALKVLKDLPKKERTEAARALLPSSFTCDLEMSINFESLVNLILARWYDGADKSMQEFAEELYYAALSTEDEELIEVLGKAVNK